MSIERTYEDGVRDSRLNNHDQLLGEHRADTTLILNLVSVLDKQVQRLGDNANSAAEATIKLAEAVNAEKISARDALALVAANATSKWSKRDSLVTGLLASITTLAAVWMALHH
jgi:hypothetical protein